MIEYKLFQPYPYLLHFRDPQGTCFSIIKGEKKAIVVDNGYGIGDVKTLVEKYITTPYIVICTHGHMDHTGGNFQFKEVYLNPLDYELCKEHNNVFRRTKNIEDAISKGLIDDTYNIDKYINESYGNLLPIYPGTIINLGDINVEIISMPGHTKGSIGLLLKEKRLLLSGDAAILMIWLFLKESTTRATYIEMLEKTKELPFDNFITGHIQRLFPKNYFDYFIKVAKIANKDNSQKVIFKNFEDDNTYQYEELINGDVVGICFREE